MILEALLSNKRVSLDFHLHIVVNILVKQMVSARISFNSGDFETSYRERAAHLLARVVNK